MVNYHYPYLNEIRVRIQFLLLLILLCPYSQAFSQQRNPESYHCDSTRAKRSICGESFWCFDGKSSEISVWFNYVGHWFYDGVYCTKDSVLIFKDTTIRSDYYEKLMKCTQISSIKPINCVVEQYNKVIDGQLFRNVYKPDEYVYKGNTVYRNCKFINGANFSGGHYEGDVYFEDCEFSGLIILPSGNSKIIIRQSVLSNVEFTSNKNVYGIIIESSKISGLKYQSKYLTKEMMLLGCQIDTYARIVRSRVERLILKNLRFRDLIELSSGVNIDSLVVVGLDPLSEGSKLRFANTNVVKELNLAEQVVKYSIIMHEANFEQGIVVSSTDFFSLADFRGASSPVLLDAHHTVVRDSMLLNENSFKAGIRLSEAMISGLCKVYLEPDQIGRKIEFLWDDYSSGVIVFDFTVKGKRKENFSKIQKILRLQYKELTATGDENSAADVAMEIKRFRAELIGGEADRFMGWLFGYGTIPWNFFGIISAVVLLYSGLYSLRRDESFRLALTISANDSASETFSIHRFQRFVILVYLSASIFVSLRYKKEWLRIESVALAIFVATEYLIGIVSIALFIIYVANSVPQLEFVKQWVM